MIQKISYFLFVFLIVGISSYYFWNKNSSSLQKRSLKILTYSSFAGLYGPGRPLQKKFESFCDCKVEWFIAEDSTALLQRLHILPSIDVVIGFDQLSLVEQGKFKWKKIPPMNRPFYKEVEKWNSDFLIPIDWAPISFIVKDSKEGISHLKKLHHIKSKISFPSPTSSTLGLQFYYWIYETFLGNVKDIKTFLNQMKNKIYGPVFSWSLSYGYFQKGRVSMSLSYITSLAYHIKEEQDFSYKASYFKEGHPYQVEFAAIPESCENCSVAFRFVKFLLSSDSQALIRDKHYMFPVVKDVDKNPSIHFKIPKLISYDRMNEFIKKKDYLLKIWKENLY